MGSYRSMGYAEGKSNPTPRSSIRMTTALLLIAHGSREEEANADLHHVVAALRTCGGYVRVEACFLELAEPTWEEAGARCAASGAGRVVVVPYFLSAGVHFRRDLALIRTMLADRFPWVAFRLA